MANETALVTQDWINAKIKQAERRAWLRGATYGYAYGTGETRKVPEFIAERNPYGRKL